METWGIYNMRITNELNNLNLLRNTAITPLSPSNVFIVLKRNKNKSNLVFEK
jgi:hypothetical protein